MKDAAHRLKTTDGDPISTPQVPHKLDSLVSELLAALGDERLSARELMGRLGLADRKHFYEAYLKPALAAGVIEMTIPEKPRSPKQRYQKAR